MVNLLPKKIQRAASVMYYSHFATLLFFGVGVAVLASSTLLVPSYLRAKAEAAAAASYLAQSEKASGGAGSSRNDLTLLSERITLLKTFVRTSEAARTLSLLTAQVPKGVSLTKISVIFGDKGAGTLSVSGKADTRESLLSFVNALQAVPEFAGARVPVSALAGNIDVSFTLAFPLTMPPS